MSVTENSPSKITDEKREKRKRVYPVPLTYVFGQFCTSNSVKEAHIGSFFFLGKDSPMVSVILKALLYICLRLQNIFWSVSVHLRPLQAIQLIEVVQKAICLYKTSVYKMPLKELLQNQQSSGNLLPVKKRLSEDHPSTE